MLDVIKKDPGGSLYRYFKNPWKSWAERRILMKKFEKMALLATVIALVCTITATITVSAEEPHGYSCDCPLCQQEAVTEETTSRKNPGQWFQLPEETTVATTAAQEKAPTTTEPETEAPTTTEPETKAPTMEPTTEAPTTSEPTTSEPTTSEPETKAPTATESHRRSIWDFLPPRKESEDKDPALTSREESTTERRIPVEAGVDEEPSSSSPVSTAPSIPDTGSKVPAIFAGFALLSCAAIYVLRKTSKH